MPVAPQTFDRKRYGFILTAFAFYPVQQQHDLALNRKVDPCLHLAGFDRRSHFQDAVAKRPAYRHSDGPTELDGRNILANDFPVFRRKLEKPFPNRFISRLGSIESRSDPLHGRFCTS
jgi:hypothetical protein